MGGQESMLILGAGAAGLSAVNAIRSVDPRVTVTVVSGERGLPYARMALPYYISGKVPLHGILTREMNDFSAQKVKYVQGDPAAFVDTGRRRVVLRSGRVLEYDKLLIATGSAPELPDMLAGIRAPGICHLWTRKDALQIRHQIRQGEAVAIWGAGFVAFMAAKALAGSGKKVFLICRASRILRRVLDEEAAALMERTLSAKGISCLKDTNVEQIDVMKGGKKRLVLTGGRKLIVDLLIVALGTKPNIGFLGNTPLKGDKGIETDERLETRVPGVYAAGDIAVVRDCVTGGRIAPALWSTAVREGWGAGLNMAGVRHECDESLLMNVIDLGGYGAVSIGHPLSTDDAEVYRFADRRKGLYRRLVFRGNRLTGAIILGKCADVGLFPAIIRQRLELTKGQKRKMLECPWDIAPVFLGLPLFEPFDTEREERMKAV